MLEIIRHDSVTELRLCRPPANAMNTELVMELEARMHEAAAADARGLVISGTPGMFCAGLDVAELLELDRQGIREFWSAFFRLHRTAVTLPLPIAVAITGHSPAGGAVLALHCDYRVAAQGRFKIGLNEVQVGLPLAENFYFALRRLVGQPRAQNLAIRGALIDMDEAARIGMVDELVAPEEVVPRAVAWAQELGCLPPHAMTSTLQLARADLLAVLDRIEPQFANTATTHWFSDETQGAMRAMIERLASRKR